MELLAAAMEHNLTAELDNLRALFARWNPGLKSQRALRDTLEPLFAPVAKPAAAASKLKARAAAATAGAGGAAMPSDSTAAAPSAGAAQPLRSKL